MNGSIIFFLFFFAARAAFRGPNYQHRLMDSNFFLGLGASPRGNPINPRNEHHDRPFAQRNVPLSRVQERMGMHAPLSSFHKVRVGIVGIGNCACSLVQGLSYYRDAQSNEPVAGLMNVNLGGYHISDIEISAAFDVNAAKVGRDVADAIWAPPNNTHRFAEVAPTGVKVLQGRTLDGIGQYLRDDIALSDEDEADVTSELTSSRTDVLVSYLPVGSHKATEWYAERALEAGCGFVNCIPVFIASDPNWRARFEVAGLPILGDDIKSQVGATIVHRVLANLFRERGVRLERTYQLNVGGNADFKNMLERERLTSKKISKTQAVTSQFDVPLDADNVHVGPSDHVPWLSDRKLAFIRLEGTAFGGVPLSAELKLEVWDSPNSAGVVIDAVRCAKLAMDRGTGGALIGPSSYFMKSPPQQFTDDEARERTCRFIDGTT
jgi:myo-inositol-1-phosphate synthase